MTVHPSALDLETLAAGDLVPDAALHVIDCGSCARYVGGLRAGAARFARQADSAKFVESIERRSRPQLVARSSKALLRIAFAALPALAAAAVIALFARGRTPDTPTRVASDSAPSSAPIAAIGSESGAAGVRFKGRLPIAVIRERGSEQARFVGKVAVRPLDGLRLVIALDSEQPISAGLLEDDGTWVELISPRTLEPGTHLSELTARFDQHPMRGFLVAGTPAAVESARHTRIFDRVSVLEVEVEP